MKECERHARMLYRNDPQFNRIVTCLGQLLIETGIDVNLLHDAVNLAADLSASERYKNMVRLEWDGKP